MGISANDCLINWEYRKFTNSLYFSKVSPINRFLARDHRTRNQKNFCNNIFKTLESVLLAENLSKSSNFAYNYILENFDEGIKWEWGSLENNYNLCTGICFFLDRKYGIFVKKSNLAKILGIEISGVHKAIVILKEMSYFKDSAKFSEKKEKIFEIIEFIPVFGVSLKQKKPPKDIEIKFPLFFETTFFNFFLFYVFAIKFKNKLMSLPIKEYSHHYSPQIIKKNIFLKHSKKWMNLCNNNSFCRILHLNTDYYFLKKFSLVIISMKNLPLQITFFERKGIGKNMNSKLNPKSKNLANLERLPPPAKEVKSNRFHENRLCVKNIDFSFFSSTIEI